MKRIVWVGVVGSIVYGVGYVLASSIPGGGDATDQDFQDYYVKHDRTGLGLTGVLLTVGGALAVLWLLHVLRERDGSSLSRFGFSAGAMGLTLVIGGYAVAAGPVGAKLAGNDDFVGVPVALALSQSGWAMILLGGALGLGLGIFCLSWSGRRSGAMTGWVAIVGMIVAVLQLASYIWLPSMLIPVWLLLAALFAGTARTPAASVATAPAG